MIETSFVNPPTACDVCGLTITSSFYDAKTRAGPWAHMCPSCWKGLSVGKLGTGYGQHYLKLPDGKWVKRG